MTSTTRAAVGIAMISCVAACEHADSSGEDSLPTFILTREWVVDGYDPELVPIGKLVVSSTDEVYITQPQLRQVVKFNREGVLVDRYGRQGEGPGEFRAVSSMGLLADTLWVHDQLQRRATFLSPSLELLGTVGLPASFIPSDRPNEFFTIPFETLISKGAIQVEAHRTNPDGSLAEPYAVGRAILEGDGTLRRLFMEYSRGPSERFFFRNGRQEFIVYPFTITPLVASSADGRGSALLTVTVEGPNAGTFDLARFDATGDTVFARRYSFEPVPLPRAVADAALDSLAEIFSRVPEMAALAREHAWMPPVFPPVEDLVIGRDDSIWVRLRPIGNGESRYLVLDSLGVGFGYAVVPIDIRIAAADVKNAWGVFTDSLGVQGIVKFAVP